jgi:hypothetical protein
MIKGINVSLTLKDNNTGQYLTIPVLPERIEYRDGQKQATTVNIANLGAVDFPDGVDLDTIGWASFFPARYDEGYVKTSNLRTPTTYRNILSSWKDKGTPLQVICPAAGINKRVYLKSFTWDLRGFEGDIYYSLQLKELKQIKPRKIKSTVIYVPPVKKKRPAQRPPSPKKPKRKSYTVKRGDWIIKIARKLHIKDWRNDLYEKNRKTVGPNPNNIKPGQVLYYD